MKQAVKQAEAKVLSLVECQNKTVKEVLSTSRDVLRVIFTDGSQLIISAMQVQNQLSPEILIQTKLAPIALVEFGLLDKCHLQEILRINFETRKTCLEREVRKIDDEIAKL